MIQFLNLINIVFIFIYFFYLLKLKFYSNWQFQKVEVQNIQDVHVLSDEPATTQVFNDMPKLFC